jgi:molybdopterin converting factor small subunit
MRTERMVRVEVRLFANLREDVGKDSIFLDFVNPPTMLDLIKELIEKEPRLQRRLICNEGFNEHYKILIGTDLVFPEDFSKILQGNKVAILPPVSGG